MSLSLLVMTRDVLYTHKLDFHQPRFSYAFIFQSVNGKWSLFQGVAMQCTNVTIRSTWGFSVLPHCTLTSDHRTPAVPSKPPATVEDFFDGELLTVYKKDMCTMSKASYYRTIVFNI